jgi:penicillin-binding protein 2
MYTKRIKIFIILSSLMLLACIIRLAQMQLLPHSSVQVEIDKLKNIEAKTEQLLSVRGKIYDRKGRELAVDKPTFWLNIDYRLSQYWDPNVLDSLRLLADRENKPNARQKIEEQIQNKAEEIKNIMNMCINFGFEVPQIQQEIESINKRIWDLRYYLAWKNKSTTQPFEEIVPDPNERMLMAYNFRIPAMYESYSLFELVTDNDVFIAQFEFMDIEGIEVVSKGKRYYPYNEIASQTLGWVGPATQPEDVNVYKDDKLMYYLPGEVCGRDGIEYACEPMLRTRRGEENIDIDNRLINRIEPESRKDIVLTIDIELQKRIENYMANYKLDTNVGPGMAGVIIDVSLGDILALVSIPDYDNNRTRYNWAELAELNKKPEEQIKPLINRAINAFYPAGSVVKPLILIAGMEEGKITSDEVISCPAHDPPEGWPKCWIWKGKDHTGHDVMWTNNARNAIKGSCNIYFSHLADRLDSFILQSWLYRFGYGHKILDVPLPDKPELARNLRQLAGAISSTAPESSDPNLDQLPLIIDREKKRFGIGQSDMRVTPLQAANAIAAIARGGIYMNPNIFREMPNPTSVSLNISQHTLDTVYDGMYAVINETSGTAYKEFSPNLNSFKRQDVKVYGKTGSTEAPENAWFAGFAQDSSGRKIAFAFLVEGGQHGASDAAPFAREAIQYCIDAGYIGKSEK